MGAKHPAPPRRKKTNAAKKQERLKRIRETKNEEKRLKWRDLAIVHVQNKYLIDNTLNAVETMLRAPIVQDKLGDRHAALVEKQTKLVNACQLYTQTLGDIGSKHIDKTGSTSDLLESMLALEIGNEYNQWKDAFTNECVMLAQEILSEIEDVVLGSNEVIAKAPEPTEEASTDNNPTDETKESDCGNQ